MMINSKSNSSRSFRTGSLTRTKKTVNLSTSFHCRYIESYELSLWNKGLYCFQRASLSILYVFHWNYLPCLSPNLFQLEKKGTNFYFLSPSFMSVSSFLDSSSSFSDVSRFNSKALKTPVPFTSFVFPSAYDTVYHCCWFVVLVSYEISEYK